MKHIKKHLKKILGILMVCLVLAASYWYGGNAPGSRGFVTSKNANQSTEASSETETETASDQDSVAKNEETVTEAERSSTASAEQAKIDINRDTKGTDATERQAAEEEGTDAERKDSSTADETKRENTEQETSAQEEKQEAITTEQQTTEQTTAKRKDTTKQKTTERQSTTEQQTTERQTTERKTTEQKTTEQQTIEEQKTEEQKTTEQQTTEDEQTTTEQPSDSEITAKYVCTISINCSNIKKNWDLFDTSKAECVPADGWILRETEVTFQKGDTVFDVLKDITKKRAIHMEYSFTALYGSYYIEGIGNLYEFDCGELSGWEYCVNGEFPSFGCSKYVLQDGDKIEWKYTCDLGADVGNPYEE